MAPESSQIPDLESLIDAASNMVVMTGAGISTESGVPDFRSPGGIWSKFRIIEYGEYIASESARIEDWRRRFYMKDQIGNVDPNIGHKQIADWVRSGKCSCVITQNVDGLHQRGGVPNDRIIEIHGNATTASCVDCDMAMDMETCRREFEDTGKSPKCSSCRGLIKTNVVMFGERMPERKTAEAFAKAEAADLFLTVGTSLVVQPAASLPVHAKRNQSKLAIVNREPTPADHLADCIVHAEIGDVFRKFSHQSR